MREASASLLFYESGVNLLFISTDFTYDGVSNEDMGVILTSSQSGLKEQNFGISRNTVKEKVKGRKRPYKYGFEEEVIKFQIEIMKADETAWTFENRKNMYLVI